MKFQSLLLSSLRITPRHTLFAFSIVAYPNIYIYLLVYIGIFTRHCIARKYTAELQRLHAQIELEWDDKTLHSSDDTPSKRQHPSRHDHHAVHALHGGGHRSETRYFSELSGVLIPAVAAGNGLALTIPRQSSRGLQSRAPTWHIARSTE